MANILNFILGHQALLIPLCVGIMDLIFALIQSVESNGILHWIYLQLKGLVKKDQA